MSIPWFRHQPPVYSPITVAGLVRAALAAAGRSDAHARLYKRLASLYAAERVVLTGSGTQALQLAIVRALKARGGDVVALPAFSCFDVATAAVGSGARIALYDVEPATLQPDGASLAHAIALGASVVVAAPLYGLPLAWDRLESLAAGPGAVLIEDAAQGFGATWHAKPLGALGRFSVLSFGRGKGWTGGSGGALLERQAGRLDAVRLPPAGAGGELMVTVGAGAQWALGRPSLYRIPATIPWLQLGETHYREPVPPRGLPRAAAALLDATWEHAQREAATRRRHGEQLLARVAERSVRAYRGSDGSGAGWLRFPVLVSRGMGGLSNPGAARALGVCPSYPLTLADLPAVRERLAWTDRWTGATTLSRELITLPTHSRLTRRELERIVALLPR